MKITWLGQAGFYIQTNSGLSIMIDPYMSDNLEITYGPEFKRRVPVDERFFNCPVDVIVLTHFHEDHADFMTLERLLDTDKPITILSNLNVYFELRKRFSKKHIYLQFERGDEICFGDVLLRSVFASHTDEKAIGVVVEADDKVLYHTGDTMYNRQIPEWIDKPLDYMFFPINGWGNNMNALDACRLVNRLEPEYSVPIHWDMIEKYGFDIDLFAKIFEENCKGKLRVLKEYEPVTV